MAQGHDEMDCWGMLRMGERDQSEHPNEGHKLLFWGGGTVRFFSEPARL